MTSTLMQRQVNTMKAKPAVQPLYRLADTHNSELYVLVNLLVYVFIELAAPHGHLHFVVCVVYICFKNVDFSGANLGADVALPEIAKDQGCFDLAFERSE